TPTPEPISTMFRGWRRVQSIWSTERPAGSMHRTPRSWARSRTDATCSGSLTCVWVYVQLAKSSGFIEGIGAGPQELIWPGHFQSYLRRYLKLLNLEVLAQGILSFSSAFHYILEV